MTIHMAGPEPAALPAQAPATPAPPKSNGHNGHAYPAPDAHAIASLSITLSPTHFPVQLAQTEHRLALLEHWDIPPGARVLELGCGQGDCTTVLATAVGANGHVTAVDPAPLTYGSPFTLGQAQAHITAGPLGARITWVQASPLAYLSSLPAAASGKPAFTHAILAHSLWYFSSPSQILATLQALAPHCETLCIAEWALRAAPPKEGAGAHGEAHVLAALAQAALECRKPQSVSNVRTVLSHARVKALAEEAGWAQARLAYVTPAEGMRDGQWEVGAVLAKGFEQQVESVVKDERERGVVLALKDAVLASVERAGGGVKAVRCMDAWVGVFERAQ